MRAALWLRVSTAEQTSKNQRAELETEAARRGWKVSAVYDVTGSAYRGNHNAALDAVLADARAGRCEVLMVWALDRLTRQGIREALNRLQAFQDAGVRLVSLKEPWLDASGELRPLLVSVLAWAAEFESRRKSERIRAALDRRRAAGMRVGRQPGSRDKGKRRRAGYYARHEAARPVK